MPGVVEEADYLKALYLLSKGSIRAVVRTTAIASFLNVSPSTASMKLRRLASKGLVLLRPGRGASLSRRGLEELTRRVWKEALLEVALVRMGLPLEEASREACRLASRLSDKAAAMLCNALGHPRRCPHGYSIPHPELGETLRGLEYCGLMSR